MQILVSNPNQDKILQEFVDLGKWKQAQDHCERRLKKEKSSNHRLTFNLALIRQRRAAIEGVNSYLVSDISKLALDLNDVIAKSKDYECIEVLEQVFDNCGGDLWKLTAKQHAADEDLHQTWFETKFRKHEYHEAAEACMFYRLRFPQKGHEMTMRMVLCYYLSSTHNRSAYGPCGDHESERRQTNRDMAIRIMRQAAAGTPAKTEKATALRTTADLELLVKLFESAGLEEEALSILDDDNKGLRSSLGCWDLARSKLILLCARKKHHDIWQYCYEILSDALKAHQQITEGHCWPFSEAGDDLFFAKKFAYATIELLDKADSAYSRAKNLLEDLVAQGSMNAHMALIILAETTETSSEVASVTLAYYQNYGTTHQALEALELVPKKQYGNLLEHSVKLLDDKCSNMKYRSANTDGRFTKSLELEWRGTMTLLINHLAIKYESIINSTKYCDSAAVDGALTALIGECTWTYMLATAAAPVKPAADNGIADEALIIAARACLLRHRSTFTAGIFHARILLEHLVSESRHNYIALLMLIRICVYQGAVTKAMAYYRRLDIKNLQQLKESVLLFEHISMLHPKASMREDLHPLDQLMKMRDWANKRSGSSTKTALKSIDNSEWLPALEFNDFSSWWITAPARVMINTELVGIAQRSAYSETLANVKDDLFAFGHMLQSKAGRQPKVGLFPEDLTSGLVLPEECDHLDASDDILPMATKFQITIRICLARQLMRGVWPGGHASLLRDVDDTQDPYDRVSRAVTRALLDLFDPMRPNSVKGELELNTSQHAAAQLHELDIILEHFENVFDAIKSADLSAWTDMMLARKVIQAYRRLDSIAFVEEFLCWFEARANPATSASDWVQDRLARVRKLQGAEKAFWYNDITSKPRRERGKQAQWDLFTKDWAGEQIALLMGKKRLHGMVEGYMVSIEDTIEGLARGGK